MNQRAKTSAGGFGKYAQLLAIAMLAVNHGGDVWAQDSLCIPNAQGLPWVNGATPTVDGYVTRVEGITDLGSDPKVEPGWVRSALVSYGDGGTSPLTEIRVIKDPNQDFVYLSFVVQFDPRFDTDDGVVIVLDPGWTPAATNFTTNARRLIISPVNDGAGAGGAVGNGSNCIRQDRLAVSVQWDKVSSVTNNVATWDSLAGAPAGSDVKVRSWEGGGCGVSGTDKNWSVEVKLPTKAGNVWSDLGSAFGLYMNVVKTCGDTTFCNDTNDPVNPSGFYTNQYIWPRATSTVETNPGYRYIAGTAATFRDLVSAKVKAAWLGKASFTAANSTCQGVRFANGASSIGVLGSNNSLGTTINSTNQTTNTLVARLQNDGAAAAGMVAAEFRIANWGIGPGNGMTPTFPGTWDKVPARPSGNLPSGALNSASGNSNRTARKDVPPGGPNDLWLQTQVFSTDRYCDPNTQACQPGDRDAHSCIWVLLDSSANATISESSVWRNFDVAPLSTQRRSAELSGKGWEPGPQPGGPQKFMLFTSRRYYLRSANLEFTRSAAAPRGVSAKLLTAPDDREREFQLNPTVEQELLSTPLRGQLPLWNYVWMIHANRATPLTMTIGQKTYRIYEQAGSFGRVGQHFGEVVRFVDKLSGGRELAARGDGGTYELTVADGGSARLGTLIAALEPGEPNPTQAASRYALWLALGSTFPHGSFGNQHKSNLAANLGFEYIFTPAISVEVTLGRHSFGGKNGGSDFDVTQFGANGKWYIAQLGFKPFLAAGVGGYAFPGSTRFGVNLGAGVQVDLTPQWSLEGRYTLHQVSSNSPNSSYSTLTLGLRYAF